MSDRNKKRPIETIVLSDDSDDDEHFSPPPSHRQPVASSSNNASLARPEVSQEDLDLERAIQESLKEVKRSLVIELSQSPEYQLRASAPDKGAKEEGSGNALGGMSRAQMEKERLERVSRLGGGTAATTTVRWTSSASSSSNKRPRIATLSDLQSDDASTSSSTSSFQNSLPSASSSSSHPYDPNHSLRYWNGSIRRVFNRLHPEPPSSSSFSPSSLSFSSLIGPPSTLKSAIVSSFCWDIDWVLSHFPDVLPTLLIMPRQPGDEIPENLAKISSKDWASELGRKKEVWRAVPKEMEMGWKGFKGCMHTKLLVYFHDDFCRIVIPTANAIPYDWRIIDNAFYVHDFPLRKESQSTENASPFQNPTLTQFSRNFIQVLSKLGAPNGFLRNFNQYDFSKSDQVRLVHSLQGKYTDPEKFDAGGGLASLAKGVAGLGFQKGGKWEIEATGSSIGKYTPTWLIQFLSSCSGIHPTSYFTHSLHRPSSKTSPLYPHSPNVPKGHSFNYYKLPLKIVFPTNEEMLSTELGVAGGGTIFCPKTTWNAKGFCRELFFRGKSKRDRIAAHTKMILATHIIDSKDAESPIYEGYVYVGSHNMTPSAWGNLQDGQGGKQLAINNYELGVLLPIRATTKDDFEKRANELVSYKRPLVRYSATDRPWMQDDYPEVFNSDRPTRPSHD